MHKANLRVDGADLEVGNYAWRGRETDMRHNLQPEIARRRAARWHKFHSIIYSSGVFVFRDQARSYHSEEESALHFWPLS